jgi:hypothetical protein
MQRKELKVDKNDQAIHDPFLLELKEVSSWDIS